MLDRRERHGLRIIAAGDQLGPHLCRPWLWADAGGRVGLGRDWPPSCIRRRAPTSRRSRPDRRAVAGPGGGGDGGRGRPVRVVDENDRRAGRADRQPGHSAAAAYEAAFAETVPPPVVAANRSLLAALVATNFFGQNTSAIATTEAQYGEMWAQDTGAMQGYAAASASATPAGNRSPRHRRAPAPAGPETRPPRSTQRQHRRRQRAGRRLVDSAVLLRGPQRTDESGEPRALASRGLAGAGCWACSRT